MLVASFAGSTAKGLVFWVFGPVVLGEGCLGDVDIDEDLVAGGAGGDGQESFNWFWW